MKIIATDKMNTDISYFAHHWITFDVVLATLSAFKSVNLFSDSEYLEYLLRIRRFALENL